jgi:hypothetical protein
LWLLTATRSTTSQGRSSHCHSIIRRMVVIVPADRC